MGAVTRCEGLSEYSVGSEPLPCLAGGHKPVPVHVRA
jgi:hypothetical protein